MRKAYFAGLLAVGVLVAWALQGVAWGDVWASLARLTVGQFALLLAVNALITLLFSARWWLILRFQDFRVAYLSLAAYRLAGFAVSYFTPGTQFGGEPLQVYLLNRRQQVPVTVALASVTLDKLLEVLSNFAFLVLGGTVILVGGVSFGFSPVLALCTAAVLYGLLALYTLALWLGKGPASWMLKAIHDREKVERDISTIRFFPRSFEVLRRWSFVSRLIELVASAEAQVSAFCRRRPQMILLASGLSVLVWTAVVFEFWLSLHLFGVPVTLVQTISLLCVARLSFLAPLPGGFGVFEAGQVLAFHALGFPSAIAISLSLFIRARDVSLGTMGLFLGARLAGGKRSLPERGLVLTEDRPG